MIDAFRTLASPVTAKLVRQRSRFLAFVEPVASVDQARTRLANLRRTYHDASHCASAYRLTGDPTPLEDTDDDGEPAGSAGMPILLQLKGAGLENVLAGVVRYFGGVKLGVGGLARAYADAVAAALAGARVAEQRVTVHLLVHFPLDVNPGVMGAIHHHQAEILDIRYDTEGHVTVGVAPSRVETFRRSVTERTGARARLEVRA